MSESKHTPLLENPSLTYSSLAREVSFKGKVFPPLEIYYHKRGKGLSTLSFSQPLWGVFSCKEPHSFRVPQTRIPKATGEECENVAASERLALRA